MPQIKGPALFLAQFAQDIPPYNTLENITQWAQGLGFIGVQIPALDSRLIDLDKAAESKDRPGRFRSTGDGQVDFKRVFSKLTQHGFTGWAVLEWECCIKDSVQGAREGAEFIRGMLIDVPTRAFDDFAGGAQDVETNYRILGL